MDYINYTRILGIGFDDEEKLGLLKNRISNYMEEISDSVSDDDYRNYCNAVYEKAEKYEDAHKLLNNSFQASDNLRILISKFVAFCNTVSDKIGPSSYGPRTRVYCGVKFLRFLEAELNILGVPYEIIKSGKDTLIIPKGAEELDEPLVTDVLKWLTAYPNTHSLYVTALENYVNEKTDASIVADGFRKALESFFQEFFNSDCTLENLKSEYGTYLKEAGIPKEISNNLESLLKLYTDYNNNYAKHKSQAQRNVLEYIMHQTGATIRLLILLKTHKVGY